MQKSAKNIMFAGLAWAIGRCLAAAPAAQAADLTVGTEYIYPTTYTVVQGQAGGVNGNVISTPAVQPGGFETRMVGMSFHAEALVVDFSTSSKELAAAEEQGKNGNTPLMLAAAAGDEATVTRLLKSPSVSVNAANLLGSTALMGASAGGYAPIVDLLLQHGAQVNVKSRKGSTPLQFAAKNGHADIVRKLLAAGAAVDAADEQGQTALLYAVGNGHTETAGVLTVAGANANARSRAGASPLRLAANAKNPELVALLTRSGAKN